MRNGEVVRARLLALALVVLTAAVGSAATAAREAGTVPSAEGKKRCKIVKKRVHGHIKRVRVCTTVTPSLPSKVSVTLDSAHAATASITADSGGTVSAGGVTLTVPAGAVGAPTNVTMTPVRLGGLEGQVLAAVQFEPDGLELLKPVTLTIPVSNTSGLAAFSYTGNGRNFRLYPVKVEADKATLTLFHFSGYGAGRQLPPPTVELLRNMLRTVIRPSVTAATQDFGRFARAVVDYLGWREEVGKLPLDKLATFGKDIVALENELAAVLKRYADEQHAACVTGHDVVGTGKNINRAVEPVAQLLYQGGPIRAAAEYAVGQQVKCESFELDFVSEITYISPPSVITSRVRVQSLKLNSPNKWTSRKDLDYWQFVYPEEDCPLSKSWTFRGTQPFEAKLFDPSQWYSGGKPPSVSMEVFAGEASEYYTYTCPEITGGARVVNVYWEGGMLTFRDSLRWTIDDWEYVGQQLFAKRTYTGSKVLGTQTITWGVTFTLRHTPE